MYLRGLPTAPVPCASKQLVTAGPPGYWEYAMLHDILHGLGLAAECAPNQHREGHVTSPTNDLMWAGEVGHWGLPPKLDVGRDDYYGHGRADCPDLARSPYLKPLGPGVAAYSTTANARSGRVFRATLKLDERLFRVNCAAKAGGRSCARRGSSGARSASAAGVCRGTNAGNSYEGRLRRSPTAAS